MGLHLAEFLWEIVDICYASISFALCRVCLHDVTAAMLED